MFIPFGVFSAGAGGGPQTYELISTTVLSGNATSVSFDVSTLGSTYKHLQLRATPRYDAAIPSANHYLRFNGDSANNYVGHRIIGDGGTVSSQYQSPLNAMWIGAAAGASAGSGIYGATIIDILDFSSTSKNKVARSLSGNYFASGNTSIVLYSGLWLSTTAVTAVNMIPNSGNFIAGSRFSLYGVRG